MNDISTIIAENNLAAIHAMMEGEQAGRVLEPVLEVWPLAWLEQRLRVGPPVLSEIVNGLMDIEHLQSLLKLIRDFLPDKEEDILSQRRSLRIRRFQTHFAERYFPLGITNPDFGFDDLARSIPIQLLGLSYRAYHDLEFRPGYILLLALMPYPYAGDERDTEDDDIPFDPTNLKPQEKWTPRPFDIQWMNDLVDRLAIGGEWIAPAGFTVVKTGDRIIKLTQAANTPEVKELIRRTLIIAKQEGIIATCGKPGRTSEEKMEGARVPLVEEVAKMVGMATAKRIPNNGWTNKELHLMTDGTRYEGAGEFADWALAETGCCLLDNSYDNCQYAEGIGSPTFMWTKRNVRKLAKEWPRVVETWRKIDHIVEWLEGDYEVRFPELLEHLRSHTKALPPREKRPPYTPWEHTILLKMDTGEKDDD